MNNDKLRNIAQNEISRHKEDAELVISILDELMTELEYHKRQIRNWEDQIGELACDHEVELPSSDESFVQRRLFLIDCRVGDEPDPAA